MTGSKIVTGVIIVIILVGGGIYFVKHGPTKSANINIGENNGIATTKAGKPVVSTKPTSYVSKESVVMNGLVNPSGATTSYWYEYGTSESFGSSTPEQLVGGGYLAYQAPATVSTLSPETIYYYRLSARNQYGTSVGETLNFKTSSEEPVAFASPSAITKPATGITGAGANLNGSAVSGGIDGYYWFEYGETASLGQATPVASAGILKTAKNVSTKIFDLKPGTTYYYKLYVQNIYGTASGEVLNFKTKGV